MSAIQPVKSQDSGLPPHKRFRRCILHIGTEKTGTKAIQDFLARNLAWLSEQGVCYPKDKAFKNASQWEFVAAVHPSPWQQDIGRSFEISDSEGQARFREDLVRRLRDQFDSQRNSDTLLISSEHFQSRLSTVDSISALRDFLDPWVDEYKILVYFRRQDQLALSFLSTRLKSSIQLSIEDPMEVINSTPAYYDLLGIFERWSAVFGQEAMTTRLFEPRHWPDHDLLQDFCAACELEPPLEPAQVLNPSLNKIGFHFLNTFNALYPVIPGDRSDLLRNDLVDFIEVHFAGKYYPINRSQALDFYQLHSDRNEKLRQLGFSEYPHPLFEEDFSDYPEVAEEAKPKYEDSIEIVLKIWRELHLQYKPEASFWGRLKYLLNFQRL